MAVAPRMYARSLFQAAKETNSLDVVHAELGEFATAVDEVPELRGELQGIQWLGVALTEAVVFYGLLGSILAFVLV